MKYFVQALTSSPVDAQTIYFGSLPKAPVTVAGKSKIYFRNDAVIKAVNIVMAPGDYIEVKLVNPTWTTNPLTTIFGGYISIH